MIPYRYIMILYVLFRVVVALGLDSRKKRVKITKFHERLFYSCSHKAQDLFRVAMSLGLGEAFRVVSAQGLFRVVIFSSEKKTVKITKYAISCSHVDRLRARGPLSCSDIPGPFRVVILPGSRRPFRVVILPASPWLFV